MLHRLLRVLPLGVALVMFAATPAAPAAPTPANPRANARAKALLAFLTSLETRTEHRLLSGQFTGFGEQNSEGLPAEIFRRTGEWPAMIGVDYADFSRGGLTTVKPNRAALAYWRAGGLVVVSAHLYNPANPAGGGLRDKGTDLAALLRPGTDTHTRWIRQLDELAAGLQELRAAGVVVLWRPFHEMNGNWFWWGAKPPADFVAVWRHMFDYFSEEKGLDNLLWYFGPNHGDTADAFYPGDACVDLVGFDAYTDHIDPQHIKGYAELARRPKPFGFAEFGPHGSRNPPGDYDYRRFLAGAAEHFPRTTSFLAWDEKWSPANNPFAKEFYTNPVLLNRDDLPAELFAPEK